MPEKRTGARHDARPNFVTYTGSDDSSRSSVQPTRLQLALLELAHAIEGIEQLSDRERAAAIDITRRRVAIALATHRPLLEEWGMAA